MSKNTKNHKTTNQEIAKKFLSKIIKSKDEQEDCWHICSDFDKSEFRPFFYYKRKKYHARKFSYLFFRGRIKKGLKVFPNCQNHLCVNPNHLYLASGGENMRILLRNGYKPKTGYKLPPEFSEKMSKIHKGKIISEATKKKLRLANLGKKLSEETRRKMSVTRTGKKMPEGMGAKIAFTKQGEKNYNTKLTEDIIIKIRSLAKQKDMTFAKLARQFAISQIHVTNIIKRKVWKHIK